jgi:hypothetical protein
MITPRVGLIVTGLAFGVWEAIEIFVIEVPAVAAVFAALFLVCSAWFWHRDSMRAAAGLLALFAFEVAVAPSLKAETITKAADVALGLAGIAAAVAVLVAARRTRRSPGLTA